MINAAFVVEQVVFAGNRVDDLGVRAYMSGGNAAECDTGNGATSCLVGEFIDILGTGTVGPGVGSGTGSKTLGVQLIK